MIAAASVMDDLLRRAPESSAAATRLVGRRVLGRLEPAQVTNDASSDLRKCVAELELMVVAACTLEAAAELGPTASSEQLVACVDRLAGIDARQAVDEWLPAGPPPSGASSVGELVSDAADRLQRVVPYFRIRIATCPIDAIVDMAARVHRPDLGHRARRAYDSVRSFLLRHDPTTDAQVKLVGRLYVDGEVAIDEAAVLLGSSVPDAIALLEPLGYARSLDTIALSSEARTRLYGRLRADRERRQGEPAPSRERVNRAVIASERIEGVDARAWLADD